MNVALVSEPASTAGNVELSVRPVGAALEGDTRRLVIRLTQDDAQDLAAALIDGDTLMIFTPAHWEDRRDSAAYAG